MRFRYKSIYVASELQQISRSREVIGKPGLVAFKVYSGDPFVLPIRCVSVTDVAIAADVFFFEFRIGQYPNLSQYPSKFQELTTQSEKILERISEMNHSVYFPALTRFPDFPDFSSQATTEADSWMTIVRRLAQSPTYEKAHFTRVEAPRRATDEQVIAFDDRGILRLTEEKSISLVTHFYSEDDTILDRKVSCSTDGDFLRVSSNAEYAVLSRYDSVEFWLQPSIVNFPTLTRAEISLQGPRPADRSSRVAFSIIVDRWRSRVAARAVLGAFGAFLLAMPAILGPQSDLWLRILIATIGALVVSYVTVYVSAGRK